MTGPVASDLPLQLFRELVAIDLEHRWRRWGNESTSVGKDDPWLVCDLPRLPRLEDYLQRFPQPGVAGGISVELVTDEFWARHYWGDCPAVDEYLQRFGQLREQLRLSLSAVLAELAPLVLTVYCAMNPVYTHHFIEPLEMGRQQGGEPSPYCQISSPEGHRLVIAASHEKQISRRHLLLERVQQKTLRATSLTTKGDILLGSKRLPPGQSTTIDVPVLMVLGHYAIRLELA